MKMTIGEKIKELRIKHDLTQEKLADYLFVSYINNNNAEYYIFFEIGYNCKVQLCIRLF